MPSPRLLILFAGLLLMGCAHPQFETFQKRPNPVAVVFEAPDVQDGGAVAQEYAAALRARLAMHTWVVPEGSSKPPGAAVLHVRVQRWERPRSEQPSPAAVGAITGATVGVISAVVGNRNAFWDGLWWGLWTGTHVAAHGDFRQGRGGYIAPNRIAGEVELMLEGDPRPLTTLHVRPEDVLAQMDPLKPSELDDPQRVREEEAKAFARVLVARLAATFKWPTSREPMWFKPEGTPAVRPE